ncbi:MAG: hypothetical protein AAF289_06400 [Cyanobacteria bacterium P01_A01_bin.135]
MKRFIALLSTLSAIGGGLYSLAAPPALAQSRGDTCAQSARPVVIYDQPRQDSRIVAQIIPSGRRLSLDPRFSSRGWVQITSEGVFGFAQASSLEECDESSERPREETRQPLTVGSCAVALPDDSVNVLSVREGAGIDETFNGIAAGDSIVLGRRVLYNTEQRRYWRQLLAYPPLREQESGTGEGWIAETGANTPRLQQSSAGTLVTSQGRAYDQLNISRRPCRDLFSNTGIREGQPLPERLPSGYTTP